MRILDFISVLVTDKSLSLKSILERPDVLIIIRTLLFRRHVLDLGELNRLGVGFSAHLHNGVGKGLVASS
jgi:hypothetical protein